MGAVLLHWPTWTTCTAIFYTAAPAAYKDTAFLGIPITLSVHTQWPDIDVIGAFWVH
jgi:hypothetical protein